MRNTFKHDLFIRHVLAVTLLLSAPVLEASEGHQQHAGSPSYEQLFEKAVFTEESLGDLDGAIELYRELSERSQADQSFVAQAQYRLGLCYLKKGDQDQAIAALQTLIENFPGEQMVVTQARARLSKLGYAAPRPEMSMRKIWSNGGATLGQPTPDGRFHTFTDWSTGDLAIHDLQTGIDRRVTDKGSWDSAGFAEFSVPSPDGKQIAYAWYVGPDILYDLRVVNVDGSGSRVVLDDEEVPWLWPLDWSSDGKSVFTFLTYNSGESQFAWVNVETGGVETIGPQRDYKQVMVDLSPDQQWIAFTLEQEEGSRARDIYVMDASSGKDSLLMKHPADDRLVGWSADGNHLAFLSDRSGEWGLWIVTMAAGNTAGQPVLVKSDMGNLWPNGVLFPTGFTDSGALYYGIADRMTDIYTVDLVNGVATGTPGKLTRRFEGKNSAPEWSHDGQYLAWVSKRDGAYTIVIRDTQSGEERDVPVSKNLDRIHGDGWGGIRWSTDNKHVLVAGSAIPMESWMGLFAIDVQTGEIEQVAAADHNPLRVPVWSPDAKTLFYTAMDIIVSRDIETGEDTTLYEGNVGNIALSPDGSEIAFTTDAYTGAQEHMIRVMPVTGGKPRVVYRATDSETFEPRTSLAWSPDGQYLVFGSGLSPVAESEDTEVELWRVPVAGGERESLGIRMPHIQKARIHPDGDRVVFQAGARKQEMWVLENFIPEVAANP